MRRIWPNLAAEPPARGLLATTVTLRPCRACRFVTCGKRSRKKECYTSSWDSSASAPTPGPQLFFRGLPAMNRLSSVSLLPWWRCWPLPNRPTPGLSGYYPAPITTYYAPGPVAVAPGPAYTTYYRLLPDRRGNHALPAADRRQHHALALCQSADVTSIRRPCRTIRPGRSIARFTQLNRKRWTSGLRDHRLRFSYSLRNSLR